MIIIAVSMLRLFDTTRGEWRDAIDERWTSFLSECGVLPLYIPNDASVSHQLLEQLQPQGVLLTGGGSCRVLSGIADARDETESMLLGWAADRRLPVLGVCRGMQVMLSLSGATLVPVASHVGAHSVLHKGAIRRVNSFHNYGFYATPPGYEVEAISEDGVIEAVSNLSVRHSAVMWHPERNRYWDSDDLALVRQLYGVSL